jgi:peptide/nickel transport system substrate-binding protein
VAFSDNNLGGSRYKRFVAKLSEIFYEFSLFERVLAFVFAALLAYASFSIVLKLNGHFLVEVPAEGGKMEEGMLGTPRFVNPVLATTDTDRDLTALLYSGLLRLNAAGELVPDLAESYTISDDGLTYYFKLREDAVFHDGTPVTTDDVIFTILKTQDPAIKSPKRPNWDGVRVEKINEHEIEFTLSSPYSPFIYNTTLGILPEHKWNLITAEEFPFSSLNTNPIGSGPYELAGVEKDEDEIITAYDLQGFSKYTIKKPYISKIYIAFYKNEDEMLAAFNKKQITSMHSVTPSNIAGLNLRKENVVTLPYSRIFALFFNQNKSAVLTDKNLRDALDTAIDREEIVDTILSGYATPLYSPLTLFSAATSASTSTEKAYGIDAAKEKLVGLEDKYNTSTSTDAEGNATQRVSFTIATNNVPELVAVGEKIVDTYNAIGINTELKIYDTNDLTANVIRPREYEAILFGNVINRDLDYYAFWHSSQRNDPGLNLASYTSIEGDKALEEARSSIDVEEKLPLLQKFENQVINDIPAVFLYSPDFIYVVPQIVRAQYPQIIVTPADRFAEVYNWYIETDTVWKIFAQKNT